MRQNDIGIIGREPELSVLADAFARAREGRGGITLVSGEAGVGITRLAEEAIARSGCTPLVGRAREGATPSFGPVTSVLRACLRMREDARDLGPLAEHLALLLPELGGSPASTDPDTLAEAIAAALAAQARRQPTVVFLDDLQWSDNATLELLPYIDERLRDDRLLTLATYRSDEIYRGHPVRRLRSSLRRARRLHEVEVGPLSLQDARVLVERVIGARPGAELNELVYRQTQGFPLYVEELAGALVARGRLQAGTDGLELVPGEAVPVPESVRDAVLLKLDGLSEAARAWLDVAAVAGADFDLSLVCDLAGDEEGLDELLAAGMIREIESGRGAFRHALTREAVLSEITWSRRRALNREVAEALDASGAPPEVVAEHWLEARAHAAARRALLASAELSCRLHAYRDAAAAVDRALQVWPDGEDDDGRVDALERLAHCAQVSGQWSDAVRALREVVASAAVSTDVPRKAEALRALATVHQLQGAWEHSVEARRQSAAEFEAAGLPGEAAVEWLALAGRYTAALYYDAALEAARTAKGLAEASGRWDAKARALGLEGNLLAMKGDCEAGRERVHAGLSLALERNLTEAASEIYRRLGSVHEFSSDYSGARDAYFTAVNYCRTQGIDSAAHTCLGCVSYIVYRTGEWKRTLEVCREILEADDNPAARAIADGVAGLVRAHRGETKQARKLLQSSLDIARRYELGAMELIDLYALAVVGENDDDPDAAEGFYRQLFERWKTTEERHDAIPWLCWAATFFCERGFERETTMCAEELASIASESNNVEALAGLAYALGETALVQNKPDEAAKQFEQSIARMEKLEVPLEQALAQYRLGVALRRARRGRDAVARLTSAYRLARKLGARPLAARAAAVLDELGERVEEGRHPEPAAKVQRGGLTRRQVEIARLIAAGHTNKEIAHQLYLSPRTVDMHVSNILDRLDCRSRTEAAQRARDLGLLD